MISAGGSWGEELVTGAAAGVVETELVEGVAGGSIVTEAGLLKGAENRPVVVSSEGFNIQNPKITSPRTRATKIMDDADIFCLGG